MSTIHLTNWSSRKLHGPGRKFTIMAAPRAWEHGEGRVIELTPSLDDLKAVREGTIDLAEYRRRFLTNACRWHLAPGHLQSIEPVYGSPEPVKHGDTLCCACSRAAAERGECHRVWAASLLKADGWNVVLDGRTVIELMPLRPKRAADFEKFFEEWVSLSQEQLVCSMGIPGGGKGGTR